MLNRISTAVAYILAHAGAARMDARGVEELRTRMVELHTQASDIQAKADGDGRDLTTEERELIGEIFAEFDECEASIKRRERLESQHAVLAQAQPRKAPPEMRRSAEPEPGEPGYSGRIEMREGFERDKKRWGWGSFGEMAMAVRAAAAPGGHMSMDRRLSVRMEDPGSTVGNEGVGADGGYAVPPEYRTEIMGQVLGEDQLISMTDQYKSSRNTMVWPTDETTPWGSSGVQAYWEGELDQIGKSKPALKQKQIRLHKLAALVPVSDEALEDAPQLDSYLRRKAPEAMQFKINYAIVQGTGAGQPLGLLNSGALVTVAKESGQAADTIMPENLVKMMARCYAPALRRAVWIVNQDILPQLLLMKIEGTAGGVFPVYMPPAGLSSAPFGTILGRPVFFTEATNTLGDQGDIILADMRQYLTATKVGGIRIETSMHIYFDYDAMAFRFIIRLAGQPWWGSTIGRRQSGNTNTLSPYVTLAARA